MVSHFFKNTKILLFLLSFISGLAAGLSTVPFPRQNAYGRIFYRGLWSSETITEGIESAFIRCFFFIVVSEVFVAIIIEIFARIKYRKTIKVLYDDCDSQQFVKIYASVFDMIRKKEWMVPPDVLNVHIFYAQGLFESGNVKYAIAVLDKLTQIKRLHINSNVSIKFSAYLYLLRYYYVINDKEGVELCSTIIENTFKKFSTGRLKYYNKNIDQYMLAATAINHFHQGKYSEALEYYLQSLEKASTNFEIANIHCCLAVIYDALCEDSKANSHLDLAVQKAPHFYSVLNTQQKLGTEH